MKIRFLPKPVRRVMALVLLLLILLLSAYLIRIAFGGRADSERHDILGARATELRQMVRLSSMKIYKEADLKAQVDGINVFAIGTYNIFIDFNVEAMKVQTHGDTLYAELPPETVRVLEVQGKGFRVVDSWSNNILKRISGTTLSAQQENQLRQQLAGRLLGEMYSQGIVKRARANALHTLTELFSLVPGTVIIIDPSPDGANAQYLRKSYDGSPI